MNNIVFFDLEVNKNGAVVDIGATTDGTSVFHSDKIQHFYNYIQGKKYVVAHNYFAHDGKYVKLDKDQIPIDTLVWSPLLFPKNASHKLTKDDKVLTIDPNNPHSDSKKVRDLFNRLVAAFKALPKAQKEIYYLLLRKQEEYAGFLHFNGIKVGFKNTKALIEKEFGAYFCSNAPLNYYIKNNPVELAYVLSIISFVKDSLIPHWVNNKFPKVQTILHELRGIPCRKGCEYCNNYLSAEKALSFYFNYDSFRDYKGKQLQRDAVVDGIKGKSVLVVFPTGYGKSITFQIPALLAGANEGALTVVISPLQALMKDQVDSLQKSIGGIYTTTINGSLDPIQRQKAFEFVRDGRAHILYIAPESLRSQTIKTLLLRRNVARFVIDEAHCLSSWGQDFRSDYQYIGKFIKDIENERGVKIPVSCLTATAKPQVIDDIRDYFKEHLDISFVDHIHPAGRDNLTFEVKFVKDDEDRYEQLRNLIEGCKEPIIVYTSRTKTTEELAKRLDHDGYPATYFHGQVDKDTKVLNQDEFIKGNINIIVATNAFGMGVDKDDVKMVIHYNVSSSLEDYIQEAGRAGRKDGSNAKCYLLYNKDDLNNNFALLQRSKLLHSEINGVWKAIRKLTLKRKYINITPYELAIEAGFSDPKEAETKIKTAVNELERAGYIERGQNNPSIYGNSLNVSNVEDAIQKFTQSAKLMEETNFDAAKRIVSKLLTIKRTSRDDPTAKVDYLANELGFPKQEIVEILNWLREVGVLENDTDLESYVGSKSHKTMESELNEIGELEKHLFEIIKEEPTLIDYKAIVEHFFYQQKKNKINIVKIKALINYLTREKYLVISKEEGDSIRYKWDRNIEEIKEERRKMYRIASIIFGYLYKKAETIKTEKQEEVTVNFSLKNVQEYYKKSLYRDKNANYSEITKSLFFLTTNNLLRIDGAFFVYYNAMRIKMNEKRRPELYKKSDYIRLEQYYEQKIAQIHIIGEYAEKLSKDPKDAALFVHDYFNLPFDDFKKKYFKGRENVLKYPRTKELYDKVFKELSPKQKEIIESKAKVITVFAGPGSGKTRLLVHKLAALSILERDFKNEDILMLTFSNAAATEFKLRLKELIGEQYKYVKISTFHSYAFELLSITGDKERSDGVIKEAVEKIYNNEVEKSSITKNILLIDEAQDMGEEEFSLVKALMKNNKEMKVLAVGDDDQNIFEFRDSDSKNFGLLKEEEDAATFELVDNYRSKDNLVKFSNQFVKKIKHRMKTTPIKAYSKDLGTIEVTRYSKFPFIRAVVDDILSKNLKGSIGILTPTNDQASQIYTELLKQGKEAILLKGRLNFKLINLDELRTFSDYFKDNTIITSDEWNNAIAKFKEQFKDNELLNGILKLLNEFRVTTDVMYMSDLRQLLIETELTDLNVNNNEKIVVSTMHNAKGREFDHVFMYAISYGEIKDETFRMMYVAMTRAKQSLFIHYVGRKIFEYRYIKNIVYKEDSNEREDIEEIFVELSLADINLNSFKINQNIIRNKVKQGDELELTEDGFRFKGTNRKIYFSKAFKEDFVKKQDANFIPIKAYVNHLVFWFDKEELKEYLTVLPKIHFIKQKHDEILQNEENPIIEAE